MVEEVLQIHYLVQVNRHLVRRLVRWDHHQPIRIMQILFRLHPVVVVNLERVQINRIHSPVVQRHLVEEEHSDHQHFQIHQHHHHLARPIKIQDLVGSGQVLLDQQLQRIRIRLVHLLLAALPNHRAVLDRQPIRIQDRILPDLVAPLLDQNQAFSAAHSSSNNNSQVLRQLVMPLQAALKILLLQQHQQQAVIQFLVQATHQTLFNNKQLVQQQQARVLLVQLHLLRQK